jgi:hypothetical protein
MRGNSQKNYIIIDEDDIIDLPNELISAGDTIKYKSPAHFTIEYIYGLLSKYYQPTKPCGLTYHRHELYLNPILQVKYFIELIDMLLGSFENPNLTEIQKDIMLDFRDMFTIQSFNLKKKYTIRVILPTKSHKLPNYRIIEETIGELYHCHNNFNLEACEEFIEDENNDIDSDQLTELIDLYDSETTLRKIIDTTIKIHSPNLHSKLTNERNIKMCEWSVGNGDDLKRYLNLNQQFYPALTELQSILPDYIVELLIVYASYKLSTFKFSSVAVKYDNHNFEPIHTFHQARYMSRTIKNKMTTCSGDLIEKRVTKEFIYDELEKYFGATLCFHYKPLWELIIDKETTGTNQLIYHVPIMEFIESRQAFGMLL